MQINTNARILKEKILTRKCPICGKPVNQTKVKDNPCLYCGMNNIIAGGLLKERGVMMV